MKTFKKTLSLILIFVTLFTTSPTFTFSTLAETLLNYSGVDWVSINNFTTSIGSPLVSGNGTQYTIISEERNPTTERARIVLITKDGTKRVINNIPSFKLDVATGIAYYDIYDYQPPPDYYIRYEQKCGDDVYYTLNGETLTLHGTGETYDYYYSQTTPNPTNPFYSNGNIKKVVIEDGITRLGKCLFDECKELKEIYIGNQVSLITNFTGCTKLSRYVVDKNNPYYASKNGVLFNKDMSCLKDYPQGKPDAKYAIPKSVSSISVGGIVNEFIRELYIPLSLNFLYRGAIGLAEETDIYPERINIYYEGSEEALDNIDATFPYQLTELKEQITKTNYSLSNFNNIHNNFNVAKDEVDSYTYTTKNGYYYNDSYFDSSATTYNHKLATMSLCLALSSFQPTQNTQKRPNSYNIKTVLADCGFNADYISAYGYADLPQQNSIGCAIGYKELENETLIAVAVRSGGYKAEWAGNFTLGATGDHEGFDIAANTVYSRICEYIKNNYISGNIKIWICGYSRGAATATQTAAKLNKNPIDGVNFDKNSIYAYGFATPAGAIKDNNPTGPDYNNIYSIVNFHDLVPRVAPEGWNFGRYGTTYYFPFNENSKNAKYCEDYMIQKFSTYIDLKEKGKKPEYKLNKFVPTYIEFSLIPHFSNDSLGVFLNKLVKDVELAFISRTHYNIVYEQSLVNIINTCFSQGPGLIGTTVSGANLLRKALNFLIMETSFKSGYFSTAVLNANLLFEAHDNYGAYYLAWMQTMTEKNALDWLNTGEFRSFIFNCPVNASVYDNSGTLVAEIINDNPGKCSENIVFGVDENGQKIFYLPTDEDYKIVVKARENCNVTYTINEHSGGNTLPSRIVSYSDISMNKNETVIATAAKFSESDVDTGVVNGSSVEYTATINNKTLIPDIEVAGKDVLNHKHTVTATCDETQGTVVGGGTFTTGEFCQVTATSKEGYMFDSWEVNGKTVATEHTYRFAVKKSTTITAIFVPHEHTLKNSSKKATYFNAGYKNRRVCTVCGNTVKKGKTIKKLTLKVPKVTIKASGKRIKIAYKKVKDANHFQVRYRIKGTWKTKTFEAKKSVVRYLKNLKKGKYQVQIRAFIKKGSKKAYSNWSKTKTVKVN